MEMIEAQRRRAGKLGSSRRVAQGCVLALAGLGVATAAHATTYVGTQSVDGATVDLSITTDGATGDLLTNDITGFDIKIIYGPQSATITNSNGQVQVGSYYSLSNLVATPTSLVFEGSDCLGQLCAGGANVLFQQRSIGSGGPFYCLQANGCYDYSYEGQGLSAASYAGGYPNEANAPATNAASEPGPFVLATVASAAPEPSSWVLMIAGVGLVGWALRYRPRTARLVSA